MLELEVDTGKVEMARISTVAARAQKELDIARAETKSLTNVVSGLQERLDALEARGSVGSDHPPLESGSSDDGWGPGPGPRRPHAPGGAPRSRPSASAPSLTAPSHHSAGRRNERVPPGSGSEEWRDEWLSAEYRNRRAPPRTPVRPRRPAPPPGPPPGPVPISMAGGRYGGLRDEVPRGDVEWDVGEGEDLDLDLEEFDISPPRGVRREAAELSRRRRDEDAYMERDGVNILVQRTWRNRGVATGIPWRRWTWRPWESVGEADGNLGRPSGRRSWSLRPRTPPCGKT